MNKFAKVFLFPILALALSGCSFFEFINNEQYNVDLGDGNTYVKWNLVENSNEYRPVESAYFEFSKENFRYYEDGILKKEGKSSIKYFGLENAISQLTIVINTTNTNLDDGRIYCFTEDAKDDLHQFTMMSMGYEIKPLRTGGVPVRDYHLSEMPFAFGTYVKEESERYTYQHERLLTKYNGSFVDENDNKFYLLTNLYANDSGSTVTYRTTYFRYENNLNHTFIEGTLRQSGYDDWKLGYYRTTALLYIMHGESEPAKEKGVYAAPDYHLLDFTFDQTETVITFTSGEYFDDNNKECDYDPSNFVPGSYTKVQWFLSLIALAILPLAVRIVFKLDKELIL